MTEIIPAILPKSPDELREKLALVPRAAKAVHVDFYTPPSAKRHFEKSSGRSADLAQPDIFKMCFASCSVHIGCRSLVPNKNPSLQAGRGWARSARLGRGEAAAEGRAIFAGKDQVLPVVAHDLRRTIDAAPCEEEHALA